MQMKTGKELEEMSVSELLTEMNSLHATAEFKPSKFEVNEHGSIILNPDNEEDCLFMQD
jgi:hypothetical protein